MDAYVHINNEECTHIAGVTNNNLVKGIDPLLDIVRDTPLTSPKCFDAVSIEVGCMQLRQNNRPFKVEPSIKVWLAHNNARETPYICGGTSCASNLACGKCCDEYMRKTLGAVLYPNHYQRIR